MNALPLPRCRLTFAVEVTAEFETLAKRLLSGPMEPPALDGVVRAALIAALPIGTGVGCVNCVVAEAPYGD